MTETFNTQLADRLLQMAIDNNMKAGDKFPNENELSAKFNVSRVSLREAINGLKFLGLLNAAPRRGTTIATLDYTRLIRYISFQMAFSSMSEHELFDARQSIEIGIAGLLIERMGKEDFGELRQLAVGCRRDVESPEAIRKSIEGDLLFHRKLLEFTRNEPLQAFAKLLDSFFACLNKHPGTIEDSRSAAEVHLQIVDALEQRDSALAEKLIRDHLARHTK